MKVISMSGLKLLVYFTVVYSSNGQLGSTVQTGGAKGLTVPGRNQQQVSVEWDDIPMEVVYNPNSISTPIRIGGQWAFGRRGVIPSTGVYGGGALIPSGVGSTTGFATGGVSGSSIGKVPVSGRNPSTSVINRNIGPPLRPIGNSGSTGVIGNPGAAIGLVNEPGYYAQRPAIIPGSGLGVGWGVVDTPRIYGQGGYGGAVPLYCVYETPYGTDLYSGQSALGSYSGSGAISSGLFGGIGNGYYSEFRKK